jgi:GDP-4-dehydro-6-deoxy-D-mannose reductase
VVPLELADAASVAACLDRPLDAVVHLAGVASGTDALADAGFAWTVNAAGTARLVDALGRARRRDQVDPLVLVISTAEVYGRGAPVPRRETDPAAPLSPYAASKLGGEVAALEAWRRTGLRVIVVRPFPHTGPGQDPRFVVPAFAERLSFAKRIGAPVVKVGNLEPVREFLHVWDVVDAYARLLTKGHAGEVYNVASGVGISLDDLLFKMAGMLGLRPIPEADPDLMRPADIPYLVGDAAKLRTATGWTPRIPLDETLRQVLDAAAR